MEAFDLDAAESDLDNQISAFKTFDKNNKQKLATALAEILDLLNYIHPFREGNGRTQRLALEFLAKEKEYNLNLDPPAGGKIYEKYMTGTINRNKELLAELIHSCLMLIKRVQNETSKLNSNKQIDPRYE